MKITSEQAEELRRELKALGCKCLEGEINHEIIFRDPENEIIAHLRFAQDWTDDYILTTYASKHIIWKMIPEKILVHNERILKAVELKKKMMESKKKMDQYVAQYVVDRVSWQDHLNTFTAQEWKELAANPEYKESDT